MVLERVHTHTKLSHSKWNSTTLWGTGS